LPKGTYRTNGAGVGMDGASYHYEDIRTKYFTAL